ncbi:MAG: hypothetical protein R3C28_20640 [Pirellulaceae bacterium]
MQRHHPTSNALRTNRIGSLRTGMSLLEVMLALMLLATSIGVMAQLIGIGMRAAADARALTRAEVMAESIMAELTSGAAIPTSVMNAPCPYDVRWSYSVILEQTPYTGMVLVLVVVQQADTTKMPVQYSLARLLRDPSMPIPQDPEEVETSSSSSSSTSSTSSETSS